MKTRTGPVVVANSKSISNRQQLESHRQEQPMDCVTFLSSLPKSSLNFWLAISMNNLWKACCDYA